MFLIPKKTKIPFQIFRGITFWDILIGSIILIPIGLILCGFIKLKLITSILICVGCGLLALILLVPYEQITYRKVYFLLWRIIVYCSEPKKYSSTSTKKFQNKDINLTKKEIKTNDK